MTLNFRIFHVLGIAGVFLLLLSGSPCFAADPEHYVFDNWDKNHSTIGFIVPILGGFSEVEGKFTDFSVHLDYDPDPSKASVEAVIKATSISTGIADRDNDLRSPNFFDVATYPEIHFLSELVEKRGDGYVVSGKLTMHGVTKTIDLPFQVRGPEGSNEEGWVLGIQAEMKLDRDDYGITWRHPKEAFVGDQIEVRIHLITRLSKPVPKQ